MSDQEFLYYVKCYFFKTVECVGLRLWFRRERKGAGVKQKHIEAYIEALCIEYLLNIDDVKKKKYLWIKNIIYHDSKSIMLMFTYASVGPTTCLSF